MGAMSGSECATRTWRHSIMNYLAGLSIINITLFHISDQVELRPGNAGATMLRSSSSSILGVLGVGVPAAVPEDEVSSNLRGSRGLVGHHTMCSLIYGGLEGGTNAEILGGGQLALPFCWGR
jgi:hypothetical protein